MELRFTTEELRRVQDRFRSKAITSPLVGCLPDSSRRRWRRWRSVVRRYGLFASLSLVLIQDDAVPDPTPFRQEGIICFEYQSSSRRHHAAGLIRKNMGRCSIVMRAFAVRKMLLYWATRHCTYYLYLIADSLSGWWCRIKYNGFFTICIPSFFILFILFQTINDNYLAKCSRVTVNMRITGSEIFSMSFILEKSISLNQLSS